MSKVTSKLQVTIPKAVAEEYGIEPGSEIEFVPAGESIRIVLPGTADALPDVQRRLALFDAATRRQEKRQRARRTRTKRRAAKPARGWTREELYERGRAR